MVTRSKVRGSIRLAAVALPLAATFAAGCSLLVSTDGLSSAPPAGEGGTTPVEASTAESGTAPDADAEAGADAALPPFCASLSPKPKFCADFDTGTLADLGEVRGMLSLDTANFRSPARSMAAEVPAGASFRGASILHPFGETPSAYDLSFDVYVDAYDVAADVELITMRLRSSATLECVTNVAIRSGQWTVDESCETSGTETYGLSHKSGVTVTIGKWTHVDTSVRFSPATTASLAIDGTTALTALALKNTLVTGEVTLQAGITYVQLAAASTAKVHVDNIRFDYR